MYFSSTDGLGEKVKAGIPEAEKRQREEYQRDCKDVTVLETLEKGAVTPDERVKRLERKLAVLPRILEGQKLIKIMKTRLITGKVTKADYLKALPGIFHAFPETEEFPFPPGYAVQSLAAEQAIVKCQLSKARWELMVFNRTGRIPGRIVR